jgi:hypothetical protein
MGTNKNLRTGESIIFGRYEDDFFAPLRDTLYPLPFVPYVLRWSPAFRRQFRLKPGLQQIRQFGDTTLVGPKDKPAETTPPGEE